RLCWSLPTGSIPFVTPMRSGLSTRGASFRLAPTTHLWRRRAFIAASSPPAPIPPVGAGKGRGAKEKNDRDACPGHSSFQLLPLIDPGGHTNPILWHLAISCDRQCYAISKS